MRLIFPQPPIGEFLVGDIPAYAGKTLGIPSKITKESAAGGQKMQASVRPLDAEAGFTGDVILESV